VRLHNTVSTTSLIHQHIHSGVTVETCPTCEHPFPEKPTQRLCKLLDILNWYKNSPPSKSRYKEHCDLVCVLHEVQSHPYFQKGYDEGWPTKLKKSWINTEVLKMRSHCASLMVHAPANDQFQDMKDLLKHRDPDVLEYPVPITSYITGHGWLRSAA
jgi:hypothetical protein